MISKGKLAGLVGLGVVIGAGATALIVDRDAGAADHPEMTVYMTPQCGCCGDWVDYMEEAGFETERVLKQDLTGIKLEHGLTRELASCHTALIDGYVIEGHVPAEEVERLLQEQPEDLRGLSVPGMPHGTPGMETGRVDPYNVVAFNEAGEAWIYAAYEEGGYAPLE